ncbi:UPF0047 protein YjbQ isoform X2 [Hydra vulgaris]|uniref:UPF0047 protein YjbQ isoform X2 n=1 Tax=Hydra vulgaris TaxID=6087 RepID=A0ABM4BM09_HYDVU
MTNKVLQGVGICWYQTEIVIPAKSRGIHKITNIIKELPFLNNIKIGTCCLLLKHTSASLSLNECWDDDVRADMEMILNKLAPENIPYTHTQEGPDDMPAHVKTSLIGASITIPITDGKLNLGTWQGIWLCEHRNHGGPRTLVVTVQGCN